MTKKQLKLLKCLYRKPRSIQWIKKKFKVSDIRDICSGIYHLIRTTDDDGNETDYISISTSGMIAVEEHQWFDAKFVLLQIVLPIVIAVITTLITIFLTTLLSPSL